MTEQAPSARRIEFTVRGLILGAAITVLFTAANVYLGLQVGLTFATSIPAAVISMAALRWFKNSTIWENNVVQTVASAAGTLASVVFVLPGLVMIAWWTGFPFWQSFAVCAVGGILGVMYSIPLRRALVTQSDLPYPEGVAAAEVLKVGAGSRSDHPEALAESRAGLLALVGSTIASAGFAALGATRLFTIEAIKFLRLAPGGAATGMGFNFQLALLAAGHLVGLSVGLAMAIGLFIAWGVATPYFTHLDPHPGAAADFALKVWKAKVRFVGAGAIAAAALWALFRLIGPLSRGLSSAFAAQKSRAAGETLPITERDIPIGWVGLISALTMLPLAWLVITFLQGGVLEGFTVPLILGAIVYVVVVGFIVAAVCGYMAGLIGASNSPVSGLGILAVVAAASILAIWVKPLVGEAGTRTLIAFAIFLTAVVFSVATISNDNLQDLKTGQLVEASPWAQQAALVVGVLAGSLAIPPILSILNQAYGFTGAPGAGAHPLNAPQAVLISTLAKNFLTGQIQWDTLGIGLVLGVALIGFDELLGKLGWMRIPPLAVALGIYLPPGTISPIVIGAILGHLYEQGVKKKAWGEQAQRLGVIMASGLIVGESLFSVGLAAVIAAAKTGLIQVKDSDFPMGLVGDAFGDQGITLAAIGFTLVTAGLYVWIGGLAKPKQA